MRGTITVTGLAPTVAYDLVCGGGGGSGAEPHVSLAFEACQKIFRMHVYILWYEAVVLKW